MKHILILLLISISACSTLAPTEEKAAKVLAKAVDTSCTEVMQA